MQGVQRTVQTHLQERRQSCPPRQPTWPPLDDVGLFAARQPVDRHIDADGTPARRQTHGEDLASQVFDCPAVLPCQTGNEPTRWLLICSKASTCSYGGTDHVRCLQVASAVNVERQQSKRPKAVAVISIGAHRGPGTNGRGRPEASERGH